MIEYRRQRIIVSKVEETFLGYEYKVSTSNGAAEYLRDIVYQNDSIDIKEYFFCIALNQGNKVIAHMKISEGGITQTSVDVRLVAKFLIDNLATGCIISHNHPSGNMIPSNADKELTKKLKEGLKFLDISLLDHIILSGIDNDYYSFADEGLI